VQTIYVKDDDYNLKQTNNNTEQLIISCLHIFFYFIYKHNLFIESLWNNKVQSNKSTNQASLQNIDVGT